MSRLRTIRSQVCPREMSATLNFSHSIRLHGKTFASSGADMKCCSGLTTGQIDPGDLPGGVTRPANRGSFRFRP